MCLEPTIYISPLVLKTVSLRYRGYLTVAFIIFHCFLAAITHIEKLAVSLIAFSLMTMFLFSLSFHDFLCLGYECILHVGLVWHVLECVFILTRVHWLRNLQNNTFHHFRELLIHYAFEYLLLPHYLLTCELIIRMLAILSFSYMAVGQCCSSCLSNLCILVHLFSVSYLRNH